MEWPYKMYTTVRPGDMVVNKVTPSLSGLISDVLRKSNAIKLPPHLSYRSIVEERLALLERDS